MTKGKGKGKARKEVSTRKSWSLFHTLTPHEPTQVCSGLRWQWFVEGLGGLHMLEVNTQLLGPSDHVQAGAAATSSNMLQLQV